MEIQGGAKVLGFGRMVNSCLALGKCAFVQYFLRSERQNSLRRIMESGLNNMKGKMIKRGPGKFSLFLLTLLS